MEIYDLMESYYRRERQDFQRRVQHEFIMCAVLTRYMFRKEGEDIPHPWEYYPELFALEEAEFAELKEREELEAFKERRRKSYEAYNKRLTEVEHGG